MNRREEALKAFIGIRRVSDKLLKSARKDAKRYQLNINEFAVLELLYHKGPSTTTDITKKILLANSSTTYIVDQLCLKGMVCRENLSEDKRVSMVSLTPKGLELIRQAFPCHAEMIENLFNGLTDSEIQYLRDLLKKI